MSLPGSGNGQPPNAPERFAGSAVCRTCGTTVLCPCWASQKQTSSPKRHPYPSQTPTSAPIERQTTAGPEHVTADRLYQANGVIFHRPDLLKPGDPQDVNDVSGFAPHEQLYESPPNFGLGRSSPPRPGLGGSLEAEIVAEERTVKTLNLQVQELTDKLREMSAQRDSLAQSLAAAESSQGNQQVATSQHLRAANLFMRIH
eukprot:scaffold186813_cov33-Prasinocladus_malaysianus.AAC.1